MDSCLAWQAGLCRILGMCLRIRLVRSIGERSRHAHENERDLIRFVILDRSHLSCSLGNARDTGCGHGY